MTRNAVARFALALILLSGLAGIYSIAKAAPMSIYADALSTGWDDWSWNSTRNLNNTSPVHAGSASVAVTFTQAWDGFQVGRNDAIDLTGYDTLRFWVHGGSTGGQQIQVQVKYSESMMVTQDIIAQANTWTQIDMPLTGLSPNQVTMIAWFNNTDHAQSIFYLDDISFINQGLPTPTPVPPTSGPALTVNVNADRHAISPYIYGMNFADETLAAELHLPVRRWGGNSTTRYNWQFNTHNTGSDWYFENIISAVSADQFIDQDRRTGTATIMTMPLIGWTSKQGKSSHPYDCGFRVSRYGSQPNTDPWDPDCGDGVRADGTDITANDPLDTSIAITPAFVQSWIQHLTGKYGTSANGGVAFYNLDNEPMLWNSTHRDVHPSATSYDELRDRTYQYAAAIKATDPNAKTLGPVLWGWTAYWYSAADQAVGGRWWDTRPDRKNHGDVPFLQWYLQQMHAYEQQYGTRILDYVDVHYYPQASGVSLQPAGDATIQALRLRSTRSLWDSTYSDESWIAGTEGGPSVRLIPRLREWVNANYPGTQLAITEYNWGALDHINGALAQADVLGIFGRESLDLATLWGPPTSAQPGAFAFRMYRNYDGTGKVFGDVSVRATSANQEQVAIYAAQRSNDNALTLMVINKSGTPLTSNVALTGLTSATTAQVYNYSAANLGAIVRQPGLAVGTSGCVTTFQASSITLIVIPNADQPGIQPSVFLPFIRR